MPSGGSTAWTSGSSGPHRTAARTSSSVPEHLQNIRREAKEELKLDKGGLKYDCRSSSDLSLDVGGPRRARAFHALRAGARSGAFALMGSGARSLRHESHPRVRS